MVTAPGQWRQVSGPGLFVWTKSSDSLCVDYTSYSAHKASLVCDRKIALHGYMTAAVFDRNGSSNTFRHPLHTFERSLFTSTFATGHNVFESQSASLAC